MALLSLVHGSGSYASTGLVFYLFGVFAAYWAQSSGRNPWLWFFLGWFFAPITGLFLLAKHAEDRNRPGSGE